MKDESEEEFSLEEETEEEEEDDDDEDFDANADEEDEDDDDNDDNEEEDDEDDAESDFEEKKQKPAKRQRNPPRTNQPAPKRAKAATPRAKTTTTTTTSKPMKVDNPKAKASALSSSSSTPSNPQTQVLEYMRSTNRPYSLLNVFENLHRAIPKPNLTRILDALVDKEELVAKVYGKSKIYCMNQDKLPLPSPEELHEIDQKIQHQQQQCEALEKEVKASESILSTLQLQLSDADLDAKLEQLAKQVDRMEQELAAVSDKAQPQEPVSPKHKEKLTKDFVKYRAAWVSRKRIAMEAINQIAEGMEKRVKEVNELCSIETDADVGVKEIPSI